MDKEEPTSQLIEGLQAIENEYKPTFTPAEMVLLDTLLDQHRIENPNYDTLIDDILLKIHNYKG
ncbi:MAG: hypothetical protein GY861_01825 [bacterium]|nr:hypothetical protein [bacterium]